MKFLVFGASSRPHSYNRQLAKIAAEYVAQQGHVPDWVDYSKLHLPIFDDAEYTMESFPSEVARFIILLSQVDGMIVALPEYNWSLPGHFKNLIDWISCLKPYPLRGKPVLLLSASPSRRGGMLGLMQAQIPLTALGAHIYPRFFALAQAHQALHPEQGLHDIALQQELQSIISGFLTMAEGLAG